MGSFGLGHRARVVILLLGLSLLAAAAGAALPPLADPPTGEHRPGKLVWADLFTTDLAAVRAFYGQLFGWTFAPMGARRGAYEVAYHDGFPVAGFAQPTWAGGEPRGRWIAYFSVTDVAASARKVAGAGGRILVEPRPVAGRGDMAIVADPDGVPFGLVRSASGDPPDFLPEVGEWIWALYQSPASPGAAAFYQDVAGYEVVRDERAPNARHFLLQAAGYTRASLVELPAEGPEFGPSWLYFVRVANVDDTVAKAEALGGQVVVPPRAARPGERIAVIADPVGAAIGVMEWSGENRDGG